MVARVVLSLALLLTVGSPAARAAPGKESGALEGVEPVFLEQQPGAKGEAVMVDRLVRALGSGGGSSRRLASAAQGGGAAQEEELARIIRQARALVERDGPAVFESGRKARRLLKSAAAAEAAGAGSYRSSAASSRAASLAGTPAGSLS